MKAAIFHGPDRPLTIEEVPTPEPGPGEVRIKVAACGVCHTDLHYLDHGTPTFKSPPLIHSADWYLLNQLQKFKARIRGWKPEDANGQVMVGMAQTLADEQAMKDVIAHIMTLRSE